MALPCSTGCGVRRRRCAARDDSLPSTQGAAVRLDGTVPEVPTSWSNSPPRSGWPPTTGTGGPACARRRDAESVLRALGVDASDQRRADELARHRDAAWRTLLPPYLLTRESVQRTVEVHVGARRVGRGVAGARGRDAALLPGQAENWQSPRDIDGRLVGEASFVVPAGLPPGYHHLHAASGGQEGRCELIVAPAGSGCPAGSATCGGWRRSSTASGHAGRRVSAT